MAASEWMTVGELMTRDVVSVHPETMLGEAARIMLARHVSGLPVVDQAETLLGIVTQADLLRRAEIHTEPGQPGWLAGFLHPERSAADYVRSHGRRVAEVMTTNIVTVAPDTPLAWAAAQMHEKHLKRLPVVEHGRLAGIISRLDFLRALAPLLQEQEQLDPDETIKTHIERGLSKEKWARNACVRVVEAGGVVTLSGTVCSRGERQAAMVLAENTPGVLEVRNEIAIIDPATGVLYPSY